MADPKLININNIIKALNDELGKEVATLREKDNLSKQLIEENRKLKQDVLQMEKKIIENDKKQLELKREINALKLQQGKIHRQIVETKQKYTKNLDSADVHLREKPSF